MAIGIAANRLELLQIADAVARAKPSGAKGKYLKKVWFSTTMGPGIPVDPSVTRNLLEVEG